MDTRVDFLYLSEQDMIRAGVLNAGKCVETMEDVITLLSEGDVLEGGKNHNEHGIFMGFPDESPFPDFPLNVGCDRRFAAMPAYVGGRFHMAGQKWYGSNSFNRDKGLPRSILMVTLNDVDTGAPIAYMSGNLLSAMRTGAMPGVAAKHLAKKDSKVMGLIGAGVIQHTCAMAILANFPSVEVIKIKGSSMTSKTAFSLKTYLEEHYPQLKEVVLVESYEEAFKDADIISEAVSCERGRHPKFEPEWVKPGCTIISSGSCEFPDEFVINGMTCVLDNIKMYEGYISKPGVDEKTGEILNIGCIGRRMLNIIEAGKMKESEVLSLADIINGKCQKRKSDEEILYIGVGGMPILDIAWGCDCYQTARALGIGTTLNLWEEPYLA